MNAWDLLAKDALELLLEDAGTVERQLEVTHAAQYVDIAFTPSPEGKRLLRSRGLLGRMAWRDWRRVFARWHGGATFEVVYGHAWKAEPRVAADGRAIVRFAR
mgnify:CR=1 FL=1